MDSRRPKDIFAVPTHNRLSAMFSKLRSSVANNLRISRQHEPSVDYDLSDSETISADYSLPTEDYSVTSDDNGRCHSETSSATSRVGHFRPNIEGSSDESSLESDSEEQELTPEELQ